MGIVAEIAVGIVLDDKFGRVKPCNFSKIVMMKKVIALLPVIENLTTHYMSSHTPAVLISFLPEPVVAQDLCIKVMSLKRRMMDVRFWSLEEKE